MKLRSDLEVGSALICEIKSIFLMISYKIFRGVHGWVWFRSWHQAERE